MSFRFDMAVQAAEEAETTAEDSKSDGQDFAPTAFGLW